MLARLRVNFGYKAVALICAIVLHMMAANEQNPQQSRSVTVRLQPRNVPAGALVDSSSLPPIMVKIDGSPDDISRITENSVTAYVDLSHSTIGQATKLKVLADVALTLRGEVTIDDIQPATASLVLKPRKKRRVQITVDYPKAAPAGYTYQVPSLVPR